ASARTSFRPFGDQCGSPVLFETRRRPVPSAPMTYVPPLSVNAISPRADQSRRTSETYRPRVRVAAIRRGRPPFAPTTKIPPATPTYAIFSESGDHAWLPDNSLRVRNRRRRSLPSGPIVYQSKLRAGWFSTSIRRLSGDHESAPV